MPVTTTHPEYDKWLPVWKQIRDTYEGRRAMIKGGKCYAPMPNEKDQSEDNKARYNRILERNMFYPVVFETIKERVGMVFRKPFSRLKLPSELEYLNEDTDGQGRTLTQMAKYAVSENNLLGRLGFLADHPESPPGITREMQDRLNLRAVIATYPAESIINWKDQRIGSTYFHSLIVLKEQQEKPGNDQFQSDEEDIYRVLVLVDELNENDEPTGNPVYQQWLMDDSGTMQPGYPITPRKSDNAVFRYIPFVFNGAEDNRSCVDQPPILGLSDLSVNLWQTTGDKRENEHKHGQSTLIMKSSLDANQFQQQNPNGVSVGSESGIFVGADGDAKVISAAESNTLKPAADDLKKDIQDMGGKFADTGGQAETAEAARIKATSTTAALTTSTENTSEAIEQVLKFCAEFMGANPDQVEFELNTSFYDFYLDPQTRAQKLAELNAGVIGVDDYRAMLQKAGELDPEESLEDIAQRIDDAFADAMVEATDLGSANEGEE